jgi:hypothetical protein
MKDMASSFIVHRSACDMRDTDTDHEKRELVFSYWHLAFSAVQRQRQMMRKLMDNLMNSVISENANGRSHEQ